MSPWVPVALAAAAAVVTQAPSVGEARLSLLHRGPIARPPSGLVLTTLGALLVLVLGGPLVALLAVAATLLARRVSVGRRLAADRHRERTRAVEALSLLGTDLRAGRDPADALLAAAGVATGASAAALAAAAAQARLGGDVVGALRVEGSAVPDALAGLAACWQVCSSAGSGLAAGVDRLEEGLRAAEAQRRAVETELAAPRATARLLAVLPVGGLWLAAALGAHPIQVLLHTPLGIGCLLVGLALDGLGLAWTGRIVSRAGSG
ncbi:MAG: tight adherence protein [Actinomycetota bacterium]|nr:tight adherence protein [Actinomycetota bacterium]